MEKEKNGFEIGKKFKSFVELEQFIRSYEERLSVQLVKEYSRTINNARKRGFKGIVNDDLKYIEIKYCCIHSGHYTSRSSGLRPNQSTCKQECPFSIRLKAKLDVLIITNFNEEHNHSHSKETSSFLPRNRRLDASSKKFVKIQTKKVLSLDEKYKIVESKFNTLKSLVSEAPARFFEQRLQVLSSLVDIWAKGSEVSIKEFDFMATDKKTIVMGSSITDTHTEKVSETGQDLMHNNDLLPILSPKIKKRGRLKGNDKTVIGLPTKKEKK